MSWYDELLDWNPASFGGITKLYIPRDYNWRPGLAFTITNEDESLTTSTAFATTWVSNDGKVISVTGGHLQTFCELDTTHYPFDKHSCNYEIVSTIYDSEEVMLHSPLRKINLDQYIENGESSLQDTVCTPGAILDSKISTLSNIIYIKRRPEFVMMHA